ncbi:hypothetical protein NC653_015151 [Populus alba x Populus x berolinensis]|uniref:Uncharacterized protein n=1 Tax=Populus alba x Populus x berolinensis TaxID=444605 RepID=A0AAD6QYT5_9ROSI|nr:hypothetical protein NC653_015151 [Populus alba x Populus x berolinensis]
MVSFNLLESVLRCSMPHLKRDLILEGAGNWHPLRYSGY